MTATITQAEYLTAELGYLLRRLADGDTEAAAVSVATLQNELHKISVDVDPSRETCGRITTQDGQYHRWGFLDA